MYLLKLIKLIIYITLSPLLFGQLNLTDEIYPERIKEKLNLNDQEFDEIVALLKEVRIEKNNLVKDGQKISVGKFNKLTKEIDSQKYTKITQVLGAEIGKQYHDEMKIFNFNYDGKEIHHDLKNRPELFFFFEDQAPDYVMFSSNSSYFIINKNENIPTFIQVWQTPNKRTPLLKSTFIIKPFKKLGADYFKSCPTLSEKILKQKKGYRFQDLEKILDEYKTCIEK